MTDSADSPTFEMFYGLVFGLKVILEYRMNLDERIKNREDFVQAIYRITK